MERGGRVWRTARGAIVLDRPRIVGIINVTPDSFWDGGLYSGVDRGLERAERLLEEGADLLDIGGESTRPGAVGVPADVEKDRVVPVTEAIVRRWPEVPLSVDTVKAKVATAAIDAGAWAINDVSALRLDPAMAGVVADSRVGVVLMHSRGDVQEMARYETASYGADPAGEMVGELSAAAGRALSAGISASSIVVDPGLGFSKRTEHSVAALAGLERFGALGYPVMIGPSRKRFIGEIGGNGTGPLPPDQRLEGTVGACVAALFRGALLFRVHDVRPARRALEVAEAVRRAVS